MDIHPTDSNSLQIREWELRDEGEIHDFVESQSGISLEGVEVFILNPVPRLIM